MDQTISKAERAILHTYNRYDLVLEKGDGAYLYDTDGKAYLDFGSGIGVSSLGYGNKTLQSALKKQIDQLIHTSNLYYRTACPSGRKTENHLGNGSCLLCKQRDRSN